MLHFHVNSVAFTLGPLQVHWYGLMYLLSFLTAFALGRFRITQGQQAHWKKDELSDLISYVALGAVLGGRCGYMLFYNLPEFLAHPLVLFKLWQGGMSFHGGLIGAAAMLWAFSRKTKRLFLQLTDFSAPLVPIGLGLGRIGNFINGELWGRVSDLPWAMVFPHGGALPRHPSQLYEALLEGVLLFTILWWYSSKPRPLGRVSALFISCYGSIRFLIEFLRQPDPQYGFIAWHWLTMGQLLSLPMILVGVGYFLFIRPLSPSSLQESL